MDVSSRFLDILKSIDYHVGHLPRHLFANEEQLPELSILFTWFINNITPKSNCITPKELTLYTSISSKHDSFTSLEKVSKAINKFYDESTKNSKINSSDLQILEKKIFKSQKELNDLKVYQTVLKKKMHLLDDEIALLQQKEKRSSNKTENNMNTILKTFFNEVDAFGSNIHTLHDNVTHSMTDDNKCLTKLTSKNLIHLTDVWRQQIFKMINTWFEKKTKSSEENDTFSPKINLLNLLTQSVTALKNAEVNEKCKIAKLNVIINNIFNIKNYFNEDKDNFHSNELDITNYLITNVKNQKISFDDNQQSTSVEFDDLQSHISNMVIADGNKKLTELETINSRITLIQDSIEYYIMICDVLWCLMRTDCSMVNLKCELVIQCIDILEKIFDDLTFRKQYVSNHIETAQSSDIKTTFDCSEVIKFNGYKQYSNIFTENDEIEKLSKMVQQWKSKYHYSKDESYKLATLQQKLHLYSDTVNELNSKYI